MKLRLSRRETYAVLCSAHAERCAKKLVATFPQFAIDAPEYVHTVCSDTNGAARILLRAGATIEQVANAGFGRAAEGALITSHSFQLCTVWRETPKILPISE